MPFVASTGWTSAFTDEDSAQLVPLPNQLAGLTTVGAAIHASGLDAYAAEP